MAGLVFNNILLARKYFECEESSVVHLDVEDFSEELLLAGSLWHKGTYIRTFPCMEANYPYAIKNQRGASKKPLVESWFFMRDVVELDQ